MSETRGFRARSNWGEGTDESQFAVGDIVWIPADCLAVQDNRCDPGLHRILSVFSIDEGPSFYYRVQQVEPYYNHGYRLRIVSADRYCSDRLHVFKDHDTVEDIDFTGGFFLLYGIEP